MSRRAEPLVMYGRPAETTPLEWAWVDDALRAADGYWTSTDGPAHPRPLWGIWREEQLHLSVGSPLLSDALTPGQPATVHLGSVTDVVIVEGSVCGMSADPTLIEAYDHKYDWRYSVDEYGPLTTIGPEKIMAWRSEGLAGRGGFQQSARWRFDG